MDEFYRGWWTIIPTPRVNGLRHFLFHDVVENEAHSMLERPLYKPI